MKAPSAVSRNAAALHSLRSVEAASFLGSLLRRFLVLRPLFLGAMYFLREQKHAEQK
jgi:hypothetical protein